MRSRTFLVLDKKNLKIQEKILGLKYYQEEESKSNILGIFIHKFLQRYNVTINTRKMVYQVGSQLTEEEALWLAKEIEDWLN